MRWPLQFRGTTCSHVWNDFAKYVTILLCSRCCSCACMLSIYLFHIYFIFFILFLYFIALHAYGWIHCVIKKTYIRQDLVIHQFVTALKTVSNVMECTKYESPHKTNSVPAATARHNAKPSLSKISRPMQDHWSSLLIRCTIKVLPTIENSSAGPNIFMWQWV